MIYIESIVTRCKIQVQQMMIDGTGVEWILKDIESSHSPQLSKAEELAGLLVVCMVGGCCFCMLCSLCVNEKM